VAFLIDTCALSEFTKPRPSPKVEAWFSEVVEGTEFVSVLTIGELEKGIAKLRPSRRRATFEGWFAELRDRFAERVLSIDEPVAIEWGRISARAELAGRPVPVIDAMLGATAVVHGLSVVTRNSSDIARTGAPIVDPWR
jgi:predicted nucleic acid-binding protein